MVEDADLEANVLEFQGKSFSFERSADWDGTELAIFQRRETESESKFRPKLIVLRLVVPKGWIVLDLAADLLKLGREGRPGPAHGGSALEAAAEASQFDEQGITWRRVALAEGGYLYAPSDWAPRLLGPEGRRRLGLG
ncbi:MAG TPA: hypothetical protein VLY85_04085 [Thermoplasmata archaeon]|nr:hypothetical protein [Thermoplasmata archaeon]